MEAGFRLVLSYIYFSPCSMIGGPLGLFLCPVLLLLRLWGLFGFLKPAGVSTLSFDCVLGRGVACFYGHCLCMQCPMVFGSVAEGSLDIDVSCEERHDNDDSCGE